MRLGHIEFEVSVGRSSCNCSSSKRARISKGFLIKIHRPNSSTGHLFLGRRHAPFTDGRREGHSVLDALPGSWRESSK